MVGFASNHRPNKADLMLGEKHISSRLMIQGHTISFVWIRHGTEESQQGPKKSSFKMLDWVESELHFIKNDNSHQVKAKLEQTYPKLATGGGFELLRGAVYHLVIWMLLCPRTVGIVCHFSVIPQV